MGYLDKGLFQAYNLFASPSSSAAGVRGGRGIEVEPKAKLRFPLFVAPEGSCLPSLPVPESQSLTQAVSALGMGQMSSAGIIKGPAL